MKRQNNYLKSDARERVLRTNQGKKMTRRWKSIQGFYDHTYTKM